MTATVVEFTKDELKELIEDEKSCVHLKRSEYSLALLPCYLGDFNTSIKAVLNSRKARFEKELGGILLGYKNVKLLSSDGTIVDDNCHVHVKIKADFYIFKPEVGSVLKGIVNKVSPQHVGCLVHRLFNISVPNLDQGENWLGNFIDIGHEVVLNVTHIDLHSRLPYIRASLDHKQFEDTVVFKAKKDTDDEEIEIKSDEDNITETPTIKKKKHKNNINNITENGINDETVTVKEKKKKHKSKDKDKQEIDITHIKKEINISTEETDNYNTNHIKKEHKKKHKHKHNKEEKQIKEEISIKVEKRESLNGEENSITPKSKKNKSSKEDNKSLNSTSILDFGSPLNTSMADWEDRKDKRIRHRNTSNISLENIEINLHDSDLERTLNDSYKKKKKKKDKELDESKVEDLSEKVKSKKRKREEASDNENEVVKKHKKKKRHSEEVNSL